MNKDHLNDLKQLIATSVQTINSRFDVLERRFDGVDARLNSHDEQFKKIAERFDDNDAKFATISARFDDTDRELVTMNARFDDTDRKLAVINTRFDDNEIIQNEILDIIGKEYEGYSKALRAQADHIDDHERRIVKLEKRAV